jgi:hypothetical protein
MVEAPTVVSSFLVVTIHHLSADLLRYPAVLKNLWRWLPPMVIPAAAAISL